MGFNPYAQPNSFSNGSEMNPIAYQQGNKFSAYDVSL